MANKVGRPKTQPKSPAELRQLALEGIHRTQHRYKGEIAKDVENLVETVDSITYRNRFTQEEMNELKQKVSMTSLSLEEWQMMSVCGQLLMQELMPPYLRVPHQLVSR